jgi:hypothetical protein
MIYEIASFPKIIHGETLSVIFRLAYANICEYRKDFTFLPITLFYISLLV